MVFYYFSETSEAKTFFVSERGGVSKGYALYKRPIWPKKVRLMTGTRASKKAILISSFCCASCAIFAQLEHPSPEWEGIGVSSPDGVGIGSIIFLLLIIRFCFYLTQFDCWVWLSAVLRKKKRAIDNDVRTRFSLLNLSSIAQKRAKVKSAQIRAPFSEISFYWLLQGFPNLPLRRDWECPPKRVYLCTFHTAA